MKIRCLIVDDEKKSVNLLKLILEERCDIDVAGQCYDGYEALEKVRELQPDMVFLDIEMPYLGGMDTAERLMLESDPPLVVFVTAHEEYALHSHRVGASGYIVKPYQPDEIFSVVDRLRSNIDTKKEVKYYRKNADKLGFKEIREKYNAPNDYLPVKIKGITKPFHVRDILFFYTEHEKLFMKLENGESLRVMCGMKDMVEQLVDRSFVQVHKSYLVNYMRVREIFSAGKQSYKIRMSDPGKTEVPISRSYLKLAGGIRKLYEKFGFIL
ncbi:MAG: LytTR family DNA-binding domain-containing protein [bacterium]|nr:LytTR family DNA-binding domain-containing protein [bacterium]